MERVHTEEPILIERAVRVELTKPEDGPAGYFAVYITDPHGQWSLAVDGTFGTKAERMEHIEGVLAMLRRYLGAL